MNTSPSQTNNNVNYIALSEKAARDAAERALIERGVDRANEYAAQSDPITILGWAHWWDKQKNVTPGLLVSKIQSGQRPPADKKSSLDEERQYGNDVVGWLRDRFPDACKVNPEIVKLERELYPGPISDALEGYSDPHYAAVAAVLKLHHRKGRGGLTVREDGPEIRAAVRAADKTAIEDLKAIKAKRAER